MNTEINYDWDDDRQDEDGEDDERAYDAEIVED